jgi:hypothetical protein
MMEINLEVNDDGLREDWRFGDDGFIYEIFEVFEM